MNSLKVTFSNKPKLICLHTVKWFQAFNLTLITCLFTVKLTYVWYMVK